jgi:hypothetical protein
MGARITGTGGKGKKTPKAIEIGCLNTVAHKGYKIVNFKIPAGQQTANCPECGRKAGRE